MSNGWLDGFFTIKLANNGSYNQTLPESDFRISGLFFFYHVQSLCLSTRFVLQNSKSVFIKDAFINAVALSRE